MLAGIMANIELRIHCLELLKSILHREYATNYDGRLSIHPHITLENLRETLIHTLCYATMLLSTTKCEFTIALPCIFSYLS